MALIIDAPRVKNCGDCIGYYRCKGWTDEPYSCPIIGEIPDKHGDLIDEDEFRQVIYREIRNHKEDEPITMILKGILWEMDNAPVIVEAME